MCLVIIYYCCRYNLFANISVTRNLTFVLSRLQPPSSSALNVAREVRDNSVFLIVFSCLLSSFLSSLVFYMIRLILIRVYDFIRFNKTLNVLLKSFRKSVIASSHRPKMNFTGGACTRQSVSPLSRLTFKTRWHINFAVRHRNLDGYTDPWLSVHCIHELNV